MKLFEIMNDFLQGKKIRRATWHSSLWIEYKEQTESARLYIMEDEGVRLLDVNTQFTISDIIAVDWEFYEGENV